MHFPPLDTAKPEQDEKSKKLALIYKLWAKIQYGLCGQRLRVNDEALARGDFKALHLNSHQRKSLGLLLHVLFSNPRILYAPNTTDVNDVIDKVRRGGGWQHGENSYSLQQGVCLSQICSLERKFQASKDCWKQKQTVLAPVPEHISFNNLDRISN